MVAQRHDLSKFGDGIADLFAGCDSDDAEAASWNIAQILALVATSHTKDWR